MGSGSEKRRRKNLGEVLVAGIRLAGSAPQNKKEKDLSRFGEPPATAVLLELDLRSGVQKILSTWNFHTVDTCAHTSECVDIIHVSVVPSEALCEFWFAAT